MKNINLRPLTLGDAEFILRLTTDESWLRNIGDRGVYDLDSARDYIDKNVLPSYAKQGMGLKGIEDPDSGNLLGMCGLLQRSYLNYPDLGFALLPEFRGQGVAFQAASVCLSSNLSTVHPIIVAMTNPDNVASKTLLRKLNFLDIGQVEIEGRPSTLFCRTSVEKQS